ncbi:hypothetical protein PoB_005433800 [Plakobranchus ocellatus]|uniref:Uncharacterized protein n=1 Tax=Plakobranchus ocellatus TaxID=259542 RepID=A0AAV4C7I5_9GAST|nr:hypothetical protein PoB_005433800 [Plakobranchus ocellatus]
MEPFCTLIISDTQDVEGATDAVCDHDLALTGFLNLLRSTCRLDLSTRPVDSICRLESVSSLLQGIHTNCEGAFSCFASAVSGYASKGKRPVYLESQAAALNNNILLC